MSDDNLSVLKAFGYTGSKEFSWREAIDFASKGEAIEKLVCDMLGGSTAESARNCSDASELGGFAGFIYSVFFGDIPGCVTGGAENCGSMAMGMVAAGSGKFLNKGLRELQEAAKISGKAVNLPAWKKVGIDMAHILSGHAQGGSRVSPLKDLFPASMKEGEIEATVRQAYRRATMAGSSQGPRVLLRGEANGLVVEMWVNRETKMIETAYPKY